MPRKISTKSNCMQNGRLSAIIVFDKRDIWKPCQTARPYKKICGFSRGDIPYEAEKFQLHQIQNG